MLGSACIITGTIPSSLNRIAEPYAGVRDICSLTLSCITATSLPGIDICTGQPAAEEGMLYLTTTPSLLLNLSFLYPSMLFQIRKVFHFLALPTSLVLVGRASPRISVAQCRAFLWGPHTPHSPYWHVKKSSCDAIYKLQHPKSWAYLRNTECSSHCASDPAFSVPPLNRTVISININIGMILCSQHKCQNSGPQVILLLVQGSAHMHE